jgi:hypothetical protein
MKAINKEVAKRIESNKYYSIESFNNDAKRYIKGIKENRVICNIVSVSSSGMSRRLSFVEFGVKNKRGYQCTFYAFLNCLGYKVDNNNTFRVDGCGMDMVFHTNYSIIRDLFHMGFITEKTCKVLEQKTPSRI